MRSAAAQISASVTDLNQLIARLDQAVKDHTGFGAYDKRGARSRPRTPRRAIGTLPYPTGQDVVELAPGTTLGSPGRIKPEIPFAEAKGRLPLPAQGRQVLAFGEKTQYGGQSKGIVLETRQGAQVTSPCDGWIVYAGEFRSYGQLLIINAGGGYHVLLAGLSQIDVQPGQFVLAAEPVGTMSAVASQQAQPASHYQRSCPLRRVSQGRSAHRPRPMVGRRVIRRCKDDAQDRVRILDFPADDGPRRRHHAV